MSPLPSRLSGTIAAELSMGVRRHQHLAAPPPAVIRGSDAQVADAGTYFVIVANVAGSVTSSNAVLAVNVPPTITAQPQSVTVAAGSRRHLLPWPPPGPRRWATSGGSAPTDIAGRDRQRLHPEQRAGAPTPAATRWWFPTSPAPRPAAMLCSPSRRGSCAAP